MSNKILNNLFEEDQSAMIEKFEIIFDRSTSEMNAKTNAVDYYLCLQEEGNHIDIDMIIETAENYGFNFDDFEKLIKENE